jgi:hypothetical protein
MRGQGAVKALFLIAAIYDGILGLAFLLAPSRLFDAFEVMPPNHWGYVQFPAALLVVFAILFLAGARDPQNNRNLIPYGILLKIAYCGVVAWHWASAGIPGMWKPFAVADLFFGVFFAWAYFRIASAGPEGRDV